MGITNPNMVITIDRLWATGDPNPDAEESILLLSKDASELG